MKMKDPLYFGRMVKVSVPEKAVTEKKREKDVKTQAARLESLPPSPERAVTFYKVKKGDTLDKIAQRHNTTISALLKLNNMKKKDLLYFGRKLKVHTHADEGEVKKTVVVKSKTYTYRVKEGDTLDKIARRYKTSISELRRLNRMKRADVLLVNQKLKLPSNPSL
jgi:LysM repeat protein